jgi:ribonuclease E
MPSEHADDQGDYEGASPGNQMSSSHGGQPQGGGYGQQGGYGQGGQGEGKRRRRRRGGRRHRRRRERERQAQQGGMGQGSFGGAEHAEDDYDERQPFVPGQPVAKISYTPELEAPPPSRPSQPEPARSEQPAPEQEAGSEAPVEAEKASKKKRSSRKPAAPAKSSRARSASRRRAPKTSEAKPAASEGESQVVKTGSADKHLADDEPAEHAPVSRPRRRYDLDAIPDDYD